MVLIVFLDALHCNGHKLVPCSPLFVEGDFVANSKVFNIFFFIEVIAEDLCGQAAILHTRGDLRRNKGDRILPVEVIQRPRQHVDGLRDPFLSHMGGGRHCTGCGGAGGGTGAAAGRQCDARSQNSQNLIFQVHKNTFFLDAVDLFRYNKNDSKTHSISR